MAEYIERKAAIAEISVLISRVKRNPYDSKEQTAGVIHGLIGAIDRVSDCPAADVVEVRHGEWLPYPSDAYMKCSVCGMEYHKSRMPDVVGYCPNPNCGAKMDGKGEGE